MIIVVGPLPPPVHGASVITERVVETLAGGKVPLLVCNTSPGAGARGLAYHTSRIAAYLAGIRSVVGGPDRENTLYLSLAGGRGLLYDLALVAAARIRGCAIVFHHHSFSYLNHPNRIMRAIVWLAGTGQTHITLCRAMASRLAEIYGARARIEVVSNLAFLSLPGSASRPPGSLAAIGFFSNISFEKGIDRYLDFLSQLRARGSRVTGIIAGPFADGRVQHYVERRIREIGGIEYLGAVYGERKALFLSSIDLLLFPSRYANEAQPLVIYEAQAAGVPVAASKSGCIPEMIGTASSELLLGSTGSDFSSLIERILIWEKDPRDFQNVVQQLRQRFAGLLAQSAHDAARFRTLFSAGT
jgi:glycosyltransferase involved in cell wall biosynthesis